MIWQLISTAPEDVRILVWDGYEINTVDFEDGYWIQVSDSGRATCFEPTHWRPTPEPPEEDLNYDPKRHNP